MRRPLIAGNWKMNLSRAQAVALARELAAKANSPAGVELAACPPFVYLDAVGNALGGSAVALGAQNLYVESAGAYTGEIGAPMLVDLGCRFVILGHSERRHLMGETNEQVARKTRQALDHGLVPIVCVGETLDEREAGRTSEVIASQFAGSLGGLPAEALAGLVVAYEPVWAIGTGRVATPEQAQQVHAHLRSLIETGYNAGVSSQTRILYGGSVKPDNANSLLAQPDIDGALVGGASLDASSFLGIAAAATGA